MRSFTQLSSSFGVDTLNFMGVLANKRSIKVFTDHDPFIHVYLFYVKVHGDLVLTFNFVDVLQIKGSWSVAFMTQRTRVIYISLVI